MIHRVKTYVKMGGLLIATTTLVGGLFVGVPDAQAAPKTKSLRINGVGKSLLINKREKKRLRIKARPSGASKAVSWKSSRKKVVSVTKKGVIRGLRYGSSYITATAKDGSAKKVRVKVQVGRKVQKIFVNDSSMNLEIGKKASVKTSVSPSNATKKKVRYQSSNKKVATVSSQGVVSAKNKGTATISIKSTDGSGKKAYCKVQVQIPSRSITLATNSSDQRLEVGHSFSVIASVYPEDASNHGVRYWSGNPAVATVSANGVVTGVSPGVTTIHVDAADGKSSATLEVEVYKVEISGEKLIAHRGLSSQAPENTTEAFRLAISQGFYGIECDIHKTLDDEFVVIHNADLKASCGVDLKVANMAVSQIKEYNIISGNNINKYPDLKIPTLEEYLEIMATSNTIHPFIELKEEYTEDELQSIVDKVASYGLLERTYFISMHQTNLLTLKQIEGVQKDKLQYVYGVNETANVSDTVIDWCIQNSVDLDTKYKLITAEQIARLQENGRKVNVWTVKNVKDAYELVTQYNVDMITTDYMLNS